MAHTQPAAELIPVREKLAYGAVTYTYGMLAGTVSMFLLYYYTDVLLLPTGIVSVVLLVVRLFDGAVDPLIGYYLDRGRTSRGKYIRYIRRWSIPFCLLSALLWAPVPFSGSGLVLFCFVSYLAWSFATSMIESASLPVLVVMTRDPQQRRQINTVKVVGGIVATLAARYGTLELVKLLGKGAEQKGFALCMVLYSAVGLLLMRPAAGRIVERNTRPAHTFVVTKAALLLLKNKKLLYILMFYLCNQMASSVKGQAAIYYMKYIVERQDLTSLFLLMGVAGSLLIQPVIVKVGRVVSIKVLIVAGYVGAAASMLLMGFSGTRVELLMLGNLLYGITTAFPANLLYVYVAEVVDRQGGQLNAMSHSFLALSARLGTSLAGALIAFLLYLAKYTPNTVQQASSLEGIQVVFIVLTAILYGLAAVLAALSYRCKFTAEEAGT